MSKEDMAASNPQFYYHAQGGTPQQTPPGTQYTGSTPVGAGYPPGVAGAPPPGANADPGGVYYGPGVGQQQAAFPMVDAGTAALGQQLFTNLVSGQGARFLSQSQDQVSRFARLPKYYFQVNNRFVLRKIMLILFPLANKTWARRRAVDSGEGGVSDPTSVGYLPPAHDVNAPDLYIPVMSFVTYILLVGFLRGQRSTFKPEDMAATGSKGLGLLVLEVLIIRFGLYLVDSRSIAWFDIIALQSYKFVGLIIVLLAAFILPVRAVYYLSLLYCSTMMGLFLMRTYRRLVLPAGSSYASDTVGGSGAADLAKKNYFLLFVFLLQYPVFLLLAERA